MEGRGHVTPALGDVEGGRLCEPRREGQTMIKPRARKDKFSGTGRRITGRRERTGENERAKPLGWDAGLSDHLGVWTAGPTPDSRKKR